MSCGDFVRKQSLQQPFCLFHNDRSDAVAAAKPNGYSLEHRVILSWLRFCHLLGSCELLSEQCFKLRGSFLYICFSVFFTHNSVLLLFIALPATGTDHSRPGSPYSLYDSDASAINRKIC